MSEKPKGWFSRRHADDTAHRQAREQYATRAERRPSQIWNPQTRQWEKVA